MSLHPRRPNKTDLEEQRPECLPSAEKMRRTRHEKKSVKPSGERALRGREDGAENPTSGGKVQERQVRSRSGGQNKTLSPDAAERKAREKRAEIRLQDQEEKEATEHSGLATGLRSRKTTVRPRGNPSERDSEPRVTPCAKRGAHSLQKASDFLFLLFDERGYFHTTLAPGGKSKCSSCDQIARSQLPVGLL